jgi:drug/metabolite transporter superfamily protein YnfA
MNQPPQPPKAPAPTFTQATEHEPETSLLVEFWLFLRTNKKWWLLPVLAVLLLLGALMLLSSTPAAPFIYTLF